MSFKLVHRESLGSCHLKYKIALILRGVWIQWNGNSGMVEWIFFSFILFACLCSNYYQEYIMLKQRSVQFPAYVVKAKYQNKNWSRVTPT